MIPLAAGNKQLLETIFQSVFLSCHRRSSVGKYCGKHFFRSLIVSLSPLHAHCCRSVLPPRLCFQYSAQQSSAIWHRVHVQVFLWSADGWCDLGRQEDMYKNTGVLVCPEFVETGAAQINRNVFYRQTDSWMAAGEMWIISLFTCIYWIWLQHRLCQKALRCVFQSLHLPRPDVAAWDTNRVFIFGRTIPLIQLFVHAAVIVSPECTFGI